MLFSVLTRKGQIPRHKLSPFEVRSWLEGRLKASGCYHWGARHLGLSWPKPRQAAHTAEAEPTDYTPGRQMMSLFTEAELGRGSLLSQAWAQPSGQPWQSLWSSAGHIPACSLGPCSFPAGRGQVSLKSRRPGSTLTSFFAWWPPFHWPLAEWTNGHLLTVGPWGRGLTVVATNGWAGLTVAHWQLLSRGDSHCGADQWWIRTSNYHSKHPVLLVWG